MQEDRYEDYIRYIERTDKEQEENYWRNYLKGVQQSTLLPFITAHTAERNKGVGNISRVFTGRCCYCRHGSKAMRKAIGPYGQYRDAGRMVLPFASIYRQE